MTDLGGEGFTPGGSRIIPIERSAGYRGLGGERRRESPQEKRLDRQERSMDRRGDREIVVAAEGEGGYWSGGSSIGWIIAIIVIVIIIIVICMIWAAVAMDHHRDRQNAGINSGGPLNDSPYLVTAGNAPADTENLTTRNSDNNRGDREDSLFEQYLSKAKSFYSRVILQEV